LLRSRFFVFYSLDWGQQETCLRIQTWSSLRMPTDNTYEFWKSMFGRSAQLYSVTRNIFNQVVTFHVFLSCDNTIDVDVFKRLETLEWKQKWKCLEKNRWPSNLNNKFKIWQSTKNCFHEMWPKWIVNSQLWNLNMFFLYYQVILKEWVIFSLLSKEYFNHLKTRNVQYQ
jgi:hypothetical protein